MSAKNSNRKLSSYEFIAIISGTGIIAWIITDFFGGMILWAVSYSFIIIAIVALYIFSCFDTILSIIRKGKSTSKIKLIAHGTVLVSILSISLYHSEFFKSERIMTAVLHDDLHHHRLILRKNGDVENQVSGLYGSSQRFYGNYTIENDLLIFSKKPYDNDFLPDTLFIDKDQKAIFMDRDALGNFRTEKEWMNHFEIEEE